MGARALRWLRIVARAIGALEAPVSNGETGGTLLKATAGQGEIGTRCTMDAFGRALTVAVLGCVSAE